MRGFTYPYHQQHINIKGRFDHPRASITQSPSFRFLKIKRFEKM